MEFGFLDVELILTLVLGKIDSLLFHSSSCFQALHLLSSRLSRALSPDEELAYIADETPHHYRLSADLELVKCGLCPFSFSIVIVVKVREKKRLRICYARHFTTLLEDAAIASLHHCFLTSMQLC
jgi:hypothetical protein